VEGDGIPVYDETGRLLRMETRLEVPRLQWIPPVNMTEDGSINSKAQDGCGTQAEQASPVAFPLNCLSVVLVLSEGAYTAEVGIYDNLGKFVHSSRQKFGYCGELKNRHRLQSSGLYASYLIWNQRDVNGNLVGSGVYVWRIKLTYESGKSVKLYERQGIARNGPPAPSCAINGNSEGGP
jgi:hypothetical protein